MSTRFLAATFEVSHATEAAAFWGRLLGREAVPDGDGVLLPGSDSQVGLRFVEPGAGTQSPGTGWLHLHVTSTSPRDQARIIETALALGAAHRDVGQLPEEDHVVLADPAGEAFCVIGPSSRFLAGCGRLGEVACDGSRDVGLFWSQALTWPLVWDQDEETAIQSPRGGTKIAWGGPPVTASQGWSRQRFELTAADPAGVAARWASLGAIVIRDLDDGVELADPDGRPFVVRRGRGEGPQV